MGPIETIYRKAAEIVGNLDEGMCCGAIMTASHREPDGYLAREMFEEYFGLGPIQVIEGDGFTMTESFVDRQDDCIFMELNGERTVPLHSPELVGRRQTAMLFMAEIAREQRL